MPEATLNGYASLALVSLLPSRAVVQMTLMVVYQKMTMKGARVSIATYPESIT
jgi:hypothetical protein